MNNHIRLELPKKVRRLIVEQEPFYSRRIEGMIDYAEFYPDVKQAAIIVDCHSSEDFLKTALEDMVKALLKISQTIPARYKILLWTGGSLVLFKEKIRIREFQGMLPLELQDKSQTSSRMLAESKTDLRNCKLIFIVSDAGFVYESPQTDVSNYRKLKERMIWILGNWDNRTTYEKCRQVGFIDSRSVVELNMKERAKSEGGSGDAETGG